MRQSGDLDEIQSYDKECTRNCSLEPAENQAGNNLFTHRVRSLCPSQRSSRCLFFPVLSELLCGLFLSSSSAFLVLLFLSRTIPHSIIACETSLSTCVFVLGDGMQLCLGWRSLLFQTSGFIKNLNVFSEFILNERMKCYTHHPPLAFTQLVAIKRLEAA